MPFLLLDRPAAVGGYLSGSARCATPLAVLQPKEGFAFRVKELFRRDSRISHH
jgi:hypothetical protein